MKYGSNLPSGFRREDVLEGFPYIRLCKTSDPWGGASFGHKATIVYKIKLHTNYKRLGLFLVSDKKNLKFCL